MSGTALTHAPGQSRAVPSLLIGLAFQLTAVLVQLTGTLTTITVQQTLYGKQKDGQTS